MPVTSAAFNLFPNSYDVSVWNSLSQRLLISSHITCSSFKLTIPVRLTVCVYVCLLYVPLCECVRVCAYVHVCVCVQMFVCVCVNVRVPVCACLCS